MNSHFKEAKVGTFVLRNFEIFPMQPAKRKKVSEIKGWQSEIQFAFSASLKLSSIPLTWHEHKKDWWVTKQGDRSIILLQQRT